MQSSALSTDDTGYQNHRQWMRIDIADIELVANVNDGLNMAIVDNVDEHSRHWRWTIDAIGTI